MNLVDIIIVIIIAGLVGVAMYRIYRAKKSGSACIGCSSKGNCPNNCECNNKS